MTKRIYICAPMENAVDVSNAAKYADFVLRCGCAPFAPHFYSMCAENMMSVCAWMRKNVIFPVQNF